MRDFIAIVSGLPRSGTSMMMKMLEAGGMAVVVDNQRVADEDNPQGYYELEKVKQIKEDPNWIDTVQGKAVKVVSMLLFALPTNRKYRVVLMRRDLEEILASQRVMLERNGVENDFDDGEMRTLFSKHLGELEHWLQGQEHISCLEVGYKDVLGNPEKNARLINGFLGGGLDVDAMVRSVDQTLYRQRNMGDRGAESVDRNGLMESMNEEEKEKIEKQLRSLGYM